MPPVPAAAGPVPIRDLNALVNPPSPGHNVAMNEARKKPDRTLLGIAAAVAVLVVVALAVVFTRGEPEMLDEGTPQGVVQRYAAAVIDGDEALAAEYLTERAKKNCEGFGESFSSDMRVTLISTTERPNSADVEVTLTVGQGGGNPLGASEYETEGRFDLTRSGDRWLIDTAPWELAACPPAGFEE